jgi:phospholipid transport system transporter-binding protein
MTSAQLDRRGDREAYLSGELTFDSVPRLLAEHPHLAVDSADGVTVDLGGIRRSDSAGLALLVEWTRNARLMGARLQFRNMPEQMMALARVSSLEDVLPLESDTTYPSPIA